jgi:hypothetical protein
MPGWHWPPFCLGSSAEVSFAQGMAWVARRPRCRRRTHGLPRFNLTSLLAFLTCLGPAGWLVSRLMAGPVPAIPSVAVLVSGAGQTAVPDVTPPQHLAPRPSPTPPNLAQ